MKMMMKNVRDRRVLIPSRMITQYLHPSVLIFFPLSLEAFFTGIENNNK